MAAFSGSGWFLKALTLLLKGGVNFETDTIIAIPVSAVPDQTADQYVDDLTEINSPSSRGTLASKAFSEDTTDIEAILDAADVTLPDIPDQASFVGYVIAKDTGTDSTSPLLYWDDTANKTGNGGDIVIQFAAAGICKLVDGGAVV